ncbi:iron ABC transporter permease [Radiobacillus kanasensis]|uniref:FecCD family ABC transporter permease n=1 Tax=Radiobacillus kanasensis TaxID=2844358 RepID=UPI001E4C402E|nr:iron ABC transporter permease [Radiobacillus kanasensis]UFU00822.1 iron ABC transporter permease [Radiobacillus kanasensis]
MIHPSIVRKQRKLLILFLILLIFTIVLSIGLGYSSVSYNRIFPTILGQGTFKETFVLFEIRLPRIIITVLAGIALALSGSILQSITRNDLADPGIIGINAGSGVGIAIFFLYFPVEAGTFIYILPIVAFAGAILTAFLIYAFSYRKKAGLQPVRLVLVGIGFSMALSGLMTLLIASSEREKVDFIAKWLAGSVWGTDWVFVWAVLPWLLILIPYTYYKANHLNVLQFNDPVSIGIGLSIEKERLKLLITSAALAASAVSITGGIAFIGLMAPHLAKTLVGPRNQLFLPIAMLIGGWLLLVADTIGRNVAEPEGVSAGILVSVIGAPYFLYLLIKKA